jgi:hypothetical protein
LISTESDLANRRLAPMPGLLEDLLDQGIRARQRRNFIADHPGQNFAALRVTDASIDRTLLAASVYGIEVGPLLDQRISQSSGDERDAAVFLRIAFAVQTGESGLFQLVEEHLADHPRAVHEAMRFYPVPSNKLGDDPGHIVSLFERSKAHKTLAPLAVRLAGERDVKGLRQSIEPLLEAPDLAADAHYALACMGFAEQASANFVQRHLESKDPNLLAVGLRICAVDPKLSNSHALKHALDIIPDQADAAWAILACHFPRQTLDYAVNSTSMDLALKIRLAAFTGYADGAVALCLSLAEREGCVTPAEADLLLLVLGEVPLEARSEPNDQPTKSRALRELLLRVFEQAHIEVNNDADRCPWKLDLILANRDHASSIRIRNGKRMPTEFPSLDPQVMNVTHGLRQWLYIERAILGQHPFALSAYDVSRRQEMAMMIAEVTDELRAD